MQKQTSSPDRLQTAGGRIGRAFSYAAPVFASVSRLKLRSEIGFAAGQKNDFHASLLAVGERRAGDLRFFAVLRRVADPERALAGDREAIAEVLARGEGIGAEAGIGVIDFEQPDGCAGAVFDGGVDVIGAAAGEQQQRRRREQRRPTHSGFSSPAADLPMVSPERAPILASRLATRLASSGRR